MHGVLALILTILAVVIYLPLFVFSPTGEPSITDWFIVVFTVVASGVALIQVLVSRRQAELAKKQTDLVERQAEIMNETLVETRKSADAATTAANATQALERSRIIVDPGAAPVFEMGPIPEISDTTIVNIPYSAMNRGKSPATILDNFVRIAVIPTNCVPTQLPTPPPIYSAGRRPMAVLVDQGVNYHETSVGISPMELPYIIDHSLSLMLYGTIEYEDVFGNKRIHGFAWKYTYLPEKHPPDDFEKFSDHDWILEPGPDAYFKAST